MNIMRKYMWRLWIWCIRKGWRNTLKESIRRLETLNMNLYLLMHFFRWSFSDWCSISTLLTDMVPNVLMQFINMPFQITLHTHTPLMTFLSNLKSHIDEHHEKMQICRNTLKECMGPLETLNMNHFLDFFSCTASRDPFLIDAVNPHFSQTWFLMSLCNWSMCLFKLLSVIWWLFWVI